MVERFQTISPGDGRLLLERPYAADAEIDRCLQRAHDSVRAWRGTPLADRIALLRSFVACFVARSEELALELTQQMGRPIAFTPGEIRGFEERATTMLELAPEVLADLVPPKKAGFERFVRREPLGVVLVLAPWNYPYLTAVNAIVPALAAGNTVVLKHSEQTPLCAERLAEAAEAAGLPGGVFQVLHASHPQVAVMVRDPRVDFVAFTGSVEGGHAVQAAAAEGFVGVGLELGGKDPAWVRADADLEHAVENLVDGAFFNSGQSCCGIERIYVHSSLYESFVDSFVEQVRSYRLGDPLDPETNLGPMVRTANAESVRGQVERALAAGARGLVDATAFPRAASGTPYLAPQVLVDVDHGMEIMRQESFGPVVGIMPAADDAEALALMNDSRYGLTASIWTRDLEAALQLGDGLQTGTVFMNRCDALDPHLAWVGVKDSGRGCTLSALGYEQLTRPKSFHLRRLD